MRAARPAAGALRWRAWAGFVGAHPWSVLLVAGLPLLLLSAQALRLQPRVPGGSWLPPQLESTQGLRALEGLGRGGVVDTLHVMLELPEDVSALGEDGWQAARRLSTALTRDRRVARVQSLQSLAGEDPDARLRAALVPAAIKRAFVSGEGDATLLEVVPHDGLSGPALTELVRELRGADAAAWSGLSGTRIKVSGLPAFNLDYEQAVAGRASSILGLVLGTTFVTLFAAFRSLLIPLKAILLNLLAVSGAFGALVLVFQDGWGVRWLGLQGPLDGVFPIVPLLVFCTVFGLSMDYEVFLLARMAEARRGGASDAEALASALSSTGSLITSAAAIMVAVFAAFALGSFVLVKMLGFALAVAVLLDASVIRVAIGPALLSLAGRYNWWPGR
jgi:RND superfamily putative drug exporter